MGKLGRTRKFSHIRYKKSLSTKEKDDHRADPESPECSWFASLPYKFQFPLRSLPSVVLDQPSIENFTRIFTLLENDNAFSNQWNLIKHSQPFLMLCNFSTNNKIAPAAKRTLIVNTDLTWNVIIGHKNAKGRVATIPDKLRNSGDFIYLFNLVDTCLVCPGICDSDLIKLATAGNRQGSFEDQHGNVKARLHDDDTVRPINCSGIIQANTGVLCGVCKSYRHSLLAMLSKERRLSKTSLLSESPDKTSINSHCPWKHLTEQEQKERVRNCTLDRQKNSRKIAPLEKKFRMESITLQPDDNNVVESLFNNLKSCHKSQDPDDFKPLFLQQQENAMKCNDKRGRRWHPKMETIEASIKHGCFICTQELNSLPVGLLHRWPSTYQQHLQEFLNESSSAYPCFKFVTLFLSEADFTYWMHTKGLWQSIDYILVHTVHRYTLFTLKDYAVECSIKLKTYSCLHWVLDELLVEDAVLDYQLSSLTECRFLIELAIITNDVIK